MLEVRVDQIAATRSALSVGLVIQYSDHGPIRFAQAHVPWDLFTQEVRAELVSVFNRMVEAYLDEEPDDQLALFGGEL